VETDEGATDFISGRRSFDRQIEMLTIAVHTLQRDFAALEERVKGMQSSATALTQTIQDLQEEVHKLDKSLIARISTISVAERVLWLVVAVLIGVGGKIFG